MFNRLGGLLGYMNVTEDNLYIRLDGIPGGAITDDISNIWKTSKINGWMFSKGGGSYLVFYKFFAIEVLYILEKLIAEGRPRHRKTMIRMVELLKEKTWLRNLDIQPTPFLNWKKLSSFKSNFQPKTHQLDFLKHYENNKHKLNLFGMLLAAAPGSGKTLIGYYLSEMLEQNYTIIIAPNNAVDRVWEATIQNMFTYNPKYWCSKTHKGTPIPADCRYYIFHFEAVEQALELAKIRKNESVNIILDESHNFNEITSQRTNLFVELCKSVKSKHVIWSSGTPIKAVGSESIPLLRTIDPLFTQHVEERFKKIYGRSISRANDILANRLGYTTFKVAKTEVVDSNPIYVDKKIKTPDGNMFTLDSIKLEMKDFILRRMNEINKAMPETLNFYKSCMEIFESQAKNNKNLMAGYSEYRRNISIIRKGYDSYTMGHLSKFCKKFEEEEIIPRLPKEYRNTFKDIRSIVKYPNLKIRGEVLGRVVGRKRIECIKSLVSHCGIPEIIEQSEGKTLIFTSHVDVVTTTFDYCTKAGYKPIAVYGGTNKNLNEMLRTHEKDMNIDPCIATYDSLSTAVPLIWANTSIMLNVPFRNHEYEQAVARTWRLGQTRQVYVYNIFLDTGDEPNISTRSNDILQWSKEQVNQMLNINDDTLDDYSVESFCPEYDILFKETKKEVVKTMGSYRW